MQQQFVGRKKGGWVDEGESIDELSEEENDHASDFNKEPAAVRIIETLDEDHSFRLDEAALEKILLSPEVVDKKVGSGLLSPYPSLMHSASL